MENILYLLSEYRYLLLYPLAIVEGPILAVIAGFLCMNHLFNPLIVYPVIILGDITGDSFVYLFGRVGLPGFLKQILKKMGFHAEKVQQVKAYFDTNPRKTISLSKISLGIGIAGIYAAGAVKIPYPKFIGICLITSLIQYVFYLGIGLLFGDAYRQISQYLDFFAGLMITFGLSIILFYVIQSKRRQL